MKKILNIVVFAVLAAVFIINSAIVSFAATPAKSSVTLELKNSKNEPISDLGVYICKVADYNGTYYFPTKAFENSGISISSILNSPNESNAKDVKKYIDDNAVSALSVNSKDGRAVFADLDLGLWIIFCKDDLLYTFNPYFVILSDAYAGKNIATYPKLKENLKDNKSIYVLKKWDDNNNSHKKRPESVTVELKDGEKTIATAVLSEQSAWAYTFDNLPEKGKYSVVEKEVKDYLASYNGDSENGFVITNKYLGEKLPQTGQLWWPVMVLAFVGALFIALGIIELGVRKNGKKIK